MESEKMTYFIVELLKKATIGLVYWVLVKFVAGIFSALFPPRKKTAGYKWGNNNWKSKTTVRQKQLSPYRPLPVSPVWFGAREKTPRPPRSRSRSRPR